jgi:hypothetical protein
MSSLALMAAAEEIAFFSGLPDLSRRGPSVASYGVVVVKGEEA